MARKKKHPEHENHERWLVSYADFITLLFAFFVVMFATSQADKGKAQQVSDSVKKALDGRKRSAVVAAVLGGTVSDKGQGNAMMPRPGRRAKNSRSCPERKDKKLAELLPSLHECCSRRARRRKSKPGEIQMSMEPRGLVISFTQAALFPSGEDVISPGRLSTAWRKLPTPSRRFPIRCAWKGTPIRSPSATRASTATGSFPRRAASRS